METSSEKRYSNNYPSIRQIEDNLCGIVNTIISGSLSTFFQSLSDKFKPYLLTNGELSLQTVDPLSGQSKLSVDENIRSTLMNR